MVSSTVHSEHVYKALSSHPITKLSVSDIVSASFQPIFLASAVAMAAGCMQLHSKHNPPAAPLSPAFCPKMSLPPHTGCLPECTQPLWCMCKPGSMKEVTPLGSQWINALFFCVSGALFFIDSQRGLRGNDCEFPIKVNTSIAHLGLASHPSLLHSSSSLRSLPKISYMHTNPCPQHSFFMETPSKVLLR